MGHAWRVIQVLDGHLSPLSPGDLKASNWSAWGPWIPALAAQRCKSWDTFTSRNIHSWGDYQYECGHWPLPVWIWTETGQFRCLNVGQRCLTRYFGTENMDAGSYIWKDLASLSDGTLFLRLSRIFVRVADVYEQKLFQLHLLANYIFKSIMSEGTGGPHCPFAILSCYMELNFHYQGTFRHMVLK